MRIGDAAHAVGVAPHVLRHWEDVGVLVPPRDPGGQRRYDDELVTRGRLVLLCQRADLTLEQIRSLISADTEERAERLRGHRAALQGRVEALRRADAFLAHTLRCHHPIVTQCPECSGFAGEPL